MARRGIHLASIAIASTVGLIAGIAFASGRSPATLDAIYYPLPHHVPKYAGGASLRFAMVQDVIHERFPKHGLAHYRERDRLTRQKLATLAPDDPAAFALADDLGVGLERLGQPDDAAVAIRDKLARQQAKGLSGRDLYTSYANLGTFLIHGSFKKAQAGDAEARKRFREGLEFIKKSVEVNPEAHFGREEWQASIGAFMLVAFDKPDLLKAYDCIGNDLAETVEPAHGRPVQYGYSHFASLHVNDLLDPDSLTDERERKHLRSNITTVGCFERNPPVEGLPGKRAPFDEPTLGIIGMWRQGGGASPHFALALGEIMLRVGQRYIAWAAYERAGRMADRFWPDPLLQQFLREHCAKRQREIEATLPPAEVIELRPIFEAELARGEGFQRAYQKYEERKLAAGVPITDEHFFDDFYRGREPIASRSGSEEWYAFKPTSGDVLPEVGHQLAWGLFGSGLAAVVTAMAMRLWSRSRPARPSQDALREAGPVPTGDINPA